MNKKFKTAVILCSLSALPLMASATYSGYQTDTTQGMSLYNENTGNTGSTIVHNIMTLALLIKNLLMRRKIR
jgi:hypothetical protein